MGLVRVNHVLGLEGGVYMWLVFAEHDLGPQRMEHLLEVLEVGKGARKASIWPPPKASKFGFQEGLLFDALVIQCLLHTDASSV